MVILLTLRQLSLLQLQIDSEEGFLLIVFALEAYFNKLTSVQSASHQISHNIPFQLSSIFLSSHEKQINNINR